MLKKISFILLLTSGLFGCAEFQTRSDVSDKVVLGKSQDQLDKKVDEQTKPKIELSEVQKPKVGIILGPGGVKAFAHTGVIKELLKAGIPIDSIVGLEWGALVGALYAKEGKVHDAEWKLYKLQQKDMPKPGLFSKKLEPLPISGLNDYFKENLSKVVSEYKIPFACPILSLKSGMVTFKNRGSSESVLARCKASPPLFKPRSSWVAASFAIQEAVRYLNKQDIQLVLFVNVMSDGNTIKGMSIRDNYQEVLFWHELNRYLKSVKIAAERVDVKTTEYSILGFKDRKSLVRAGEEAGKDFAQDLVSKYGF